MIVYILKSILCLGVLWAVYHFWLSKEQLFKFNRFYLIAAVIFALTAPLITFETITYIDPVPVVESDFTMPVTVTEGTAPVVIETERAFNWTILLLTTYLIIGSLLTIRFIIGLVKLGKNVKNNPTKKWHNASLILLLKPLVPHTFFNYIFINKTEYEQDQIKEELLLHEYEHVKQRHSFDILFIELVQLVFWFNPFVYLIKKSIKLNHEFLADRAVLNTNISIDRYQQLLLQIAGLSNPNYLSSSINYSITKKRLKMMYKTKNNAKRWVFTLLLLPLFTILLYSFGSHKEILVERLPESTGSTLEHDNLYARSITLQILDKSHYVIDGRRVLKDNFPNVLKNLHTDLTKAERNKVINLHIETADKIPFDQLITIQNIIAQYGYHRIVTPFQEIVRSKGNAPMKWSSQIINGSNNANFETAEVIAKWLRIRINGKKIVINGKATTLEKFASSIDKLTANWNVAEMKAYKSDVQIQNVPDDFLKKLNEEYKKTKLYKANPTGHGLIPPPPPPPANHNEVIEVPMPSSDKEVAYVYEELKATPSEIEEYNRIVQKLNAVSENERFVKMKDFKKIKAIHDKMSHSQRNDAPPFPSIPPPPPMDTIFTYNRLAWRIQTIPRNRKANIIYLKKLYGDMNTSQKKKVKSPNSVLKNIKDIEVIEVVEEAEEIRETPPPPPPKNPLDHIVDMAKKGATFYIGGKKVTSDKAIKYAKENKSFSIETKQINAKTPSVYINKKRKNVIEIIEESGNRGPSGDEVEIIEIKKDQALPKPTAKNVVSHIKVMNRHQAKFYFNEKEITYKEALKRVRQNPYWDVSSTMEPPVVKIKSLIGKKGKNIYSPKVGIKGASSSVKKKAKSYIGALTQDSKKVETYFKNATFKIETEPGKFITKTFYELTPEEKSRLLPPPPPPVQRKPSKKQLENWSSNKKYGIWIDGEQTSNDKIASFSDNYFVHHNESKLMKNAKNYGKHYVQVNLYSKQKWDSYVEDGKPMSLSSSAVVMITLNNKIAIKGT